MSQGEQPVGQRVSIQLEGQQAAFVSFQPWTYQEHLHSPVLSKENEDLSDMPSSLLRRKTRRLILRANSLYKVAANWL